MPDRADRHDCQTGYDGLSNAPHSFPTSTCDPRGNSALTLGASTQLRWENSAKGRGHIQGVQSVLSRSCRACRECQSDCPSVRILLKFEYLSIAQNERHGPV